MTRRFALVVAVVVTAASFVAGAQAREVAGPTLKAFDLSTRAGAEAYFRSIGIDPATVIWQTGVNNYAGYECPGAGWDCVVPTAPVYQASSHGSNTFECSPSSAGTNPPHTCLVAQSNTTGSNHAECKESTSVNATQFCEITQATQLGDNTAEVEQAANLKSGLYQHSGQTAQVKQETIAGDNDASIAQDVSQKISSGGPTQEQKAVQLVLLEQTTETGGNQGDIEQTQKQDEAYSGSSAIQQLQNVQGSATFYGAEFRVIQDSDGEGNELKVSQTLDQNQKANAKKAAITQQQGSFQQQTGLFGNVSQGGSGESSADVKQDEEQTQSAKTKGAVTQVQIGPVRCCAEQSGNPNNEFELEQSSEQKSGSGATQTNDVQGDCSSSGTCQVDQKVKVQNTTTTNSCEGSECHIFIVCEGTSCFAGEGGLD